MSRLPAETDREWMAFLRREEVDRCYVVSRKFHAAALAMKVLRVVDTAALREYETMRNYNVTIAWTTVGRSRRGKLKTERKTLQINRENASQAIELFSAALRFCVVADHIEVNVRSLLFRRADIDLLRAIKDAHSADARFTVGQARFDGLDDYHAASAFLSTADVGSLYFTAVALSMDLLRWADANDVYDRWRWIDMDARALTEDMIIYRCFGGRSTKRFVDFLCDKRVSPQFLRKLVKARRDASTRREVRLELWLSTVQLEVEELKEEEKPIVTSRGSWTEFKFADVEDFKLEYSVLSSSFAKLKCTAN